MENNALRVVSMMYVLSRSTSKIIIISNQMIYDFVNNLNS